MRQRITLFILLGLLVVTSPTLAHEEDETATPSPKPTRTKTETITPKTPTPSATTSQEIKPTERKKSAKEKRDETKDVLKAAQEAKAEERLAKLKEYGLKEIDQRIEKLNELLSLVQNSTKLDPADQAALIALIENQLASLEAQKTKIEALTTDDLASKESVKDSVRKHPIFSVIEPKLRGLEASHASSQILQRVKNLEAKLDRFLAKAQEDGQDTSALENSLVNFKNHLVQAETLVATAFAEFRQMDPSDPTAAKAHLEAGKKALKSAKAELAAAKDLLHIITEQLKALEQTDD